MRRNTYERLRKECFTIEDMREVSDLLSLRNIYSAKAVLKKYGEAVFIPIEVILSQHDLFFTVTLYPIAVQSKPKQPWLESLISYLQQHQRISVIEATKLWSVSDRTASIRLKSLLTEELLVELSKGPFDPFKVFIVPKTEA